MNFIAEQWQITIEKAITIATAYTQGMNYYINSILNYSSMYNLDNKITFSHEDASTIKPARFHAKGMTSTSVPRITSKYGSIDEKLRSEITVTLIFNEREKCFALHKDHQHNKLHVTGKDHMLAYQAIMGQSAEATLKEKQKAKEEEQKEKEEKEQKEQKEQKENTLVDSAAPPVKFDAILKEKQKTKEKEQKEKEEKGEKEEEKSTPTVSSASQISQGGASPSNGRQHTAATVRDHKSQSPPTAQGIMGIAIIRLLLDSFVALGHIASFFALHCIHTPQPTRRAPGMYSLFHHTTSEGDPTTNTRHSRASTVPRVK